MQINEENIGLQLIEMNYIELLASDSVCYIDVFCTYIKDQCQIFMYHRRVVPLFPFCQQQSCQPIFDSLEILGHTKWNLTLM